MSLVVVSQYLARKVGCSSSGITQGLRAFSVASLSLASPKISESLAAFNGGVKLVSHPPEVTKSLGNIARIPAPDVQGPRSVRTNHYVFHSKSSALVVKASGGASALGAVSQDVDPYAPYLKGILPQLPELDSGKNYAVMVVHSVREGKPPVGLKREEESWHRDWVGDGRKKSPLIMVSLVEGEALPTSFRVGGGKAGEVALVASESESVFFAQEMSVDGKRTLIYHKGTTLEEGQKRNILVVSIEELPSESEIQK